MIPIKPIQLYSLMPPLKNCQPNIRGHQSSESTKRTDLQHRRDPDRCPLECFEIYFENLPPECERIFYKSVINRSTSCKWPKKLPMEVNTMGNVMQREYQDVANHLKYFTSHRIRLTVMVTNLFNKGLPVGVTSIQNITGHKNRNC